MDRCRIWAGEVDSSRRAYANPSRTGNIGRDGRSEKAQGRCRLMWTDTGLLSRYRKMLRRYRIAGKRSPMSAWIFGGWKESGYFLIRIERLMKLSIQIMSLR
jgi:hypothetical protein